MEDGRRKNKNKSEKAIGMVLVYNKNGRQPTSKGDWYGTGTVSYTHLDVYKRQSLYLLMIPLISSTFSFSLI